MLQDGVRLTDLNDYSQETKKVVPWAYEMIPFHAVYCSQYSAYRSVYVDSEKEINKTWFYIQ